MSYNQKEPAERFIYTGLNSVSVAPCTNNYTELTPPGKQALLILIIFWIYDKRHGILVSIMTESMEIETPAEDAPTKLSRSLGKRVKVATEPFPTLPKRKTLKTIRRKLYELVNSRLRQAIQNKEQVTFVIGASVGTGKTTAVANMVKSLIQSDESAPRILWLAPTIKLRDETAIRHFTDIETNKLYQDVSISYARSDDTNSPGYCKMYQQVKFVGEKRQSISTYVCQKLCELDGDCQYFRMKKSVQKAKCVIATHQAYLFGGPELKTFDAIIIDEDARNSLFEEIIITHGEVMLWRHRAESFYVLKCYTVFINLIMKAMSYRPRFNDNFPLDRNAVPLLEVLSEVGDPYDLIEELDLSLQQLGGKDNTKVFTGLETIYFPEELNDETLPIRGLSELIRTLADEIQHKHGQRYNPMCWIYYARGTKPGVIHLVLPHKELIETLQTKTTLFLDASPPWEMTRLLFKRKTLKKSNLQAKVYQHVTLFTDSLYTEILEEDHWDKKAVERLLAIWCAKFVKPLVVVKKRCFKTLCIPTKAEKIYFNSPETKGTNAYTKCDAIILIGHHRLPDEQFIRYTSAIRSIQNCKTDDMDNYACDHSETSYDIPIIGYQTPEGDHLVRSTVYPCDINASRMAQDDYSAHIIQILGRLRPSDESRKTQPIPVFLMIGEPPRDVKIDEVTTLPAWLEANDPEWLLANPVPSGRVGCKNETWKKNRLMGNEHQQQRAYDRIAQAIETLRAGGHKVTKNAVAKLAKAHKNTVAQYFALLESKKSMEEQQGSPCCT